MTPPPMTSKRLGMLAQAHRLVGADDLFAVELERRKLDRRAPRRDDDGLGRVDGLGRAFARLHLDLFGRNEAGLSVKEVDFVAAKEALDAAGELLDDALFPVLHLVHVHADVVGDEAEGRAVTRLFVSVGRGDEGFARNAAPVEADTPHFFLLDAEHALRELAQPDRAAVSARAATNHHHVV